MWVELAHGQCKPHKFKIVCLNEWQPLPSAKIPELLLVSMCSVAGDFLKKKDSKITLDSACWRTHETAMEATGVQVDDTMTKGGCKPSCHLGGSESFHQCLIPSELPFDL